MNHRSAAAPSKERFRPNGAPKRPPAASSRGVLPVAPEPQQAPFAITAIEPVDASMWPTHQGLWLQPDQPPVLSSATVDAARHHRLPSGDFANPKVIQPVDLAPERQAPEEPALPSASPAIPVSDLVPLGWDPRTLRRKEGIG